MIMFYCSFYYCLEAVFGLKANEQTNKQIPEQHKKTDTVKTKEECVIGSFTTSEIVLKANICYWITGEID